MEVTYFKTFFPPLRSWKILTTTVNSCPVPLNQTTTFRNILGRPSLFFLFYFVLILYSSKILGRFPMRVHSSISLSGVLPPLRWRVRALYRTSDRMWEFRIRQHSAKVVGFLHGLRFFVRVFARSHKAVTGYNIPFALFRFLHCDNRFFALWWQIFSLW